MSRVAVLAGGQSLERQVSLRSAGRVRDALEQLGHEGIAIDVGPDLVDRLADRRPDVAFIALHGRDGEDGSVQEILELMGVAYTASGASACMRCMDKVLTKHALRDAGLPTPDFYSFSQTAFQSLGAGLALGLSRSASTFRSWSNLRRRALRLASASQRPPRMCRQPSSRRSRTTRRCS